MLQRNVAIKEHLAELPVLPAVVVGLISTNPGADDFPERVLEVAEADPPLAIRLVAMANSAASSPRMPIVDLHQAIMRIGTHAMAQLISATVIANIFQPTSDDEKALWSHAIHTAVGARAAVVQAGSLKIEPQAGYLAGLIHDIGRFVFCNHWSDEMGPIINHENPSELALIETERRYFDIDHADTGAAVCQHWNLPEMIIRFVHLHHFSSEETFATLPTELRHLLSVVQLADWMSARLLIDAESESDLEDALNLLTREPAALGILKRPALQNIDLISLAKTMYSEGLRMSAMLGFT